MKVLEYTDTINWKLKIDAAAKKRECFTICQYKTE